MITQSRVHFVALLALVILTGAACSSGGNPTSPTSVASAQAVLTNSVSIVLVEPGSGSTVRYASFKDIPVTVGVRHTLDREYVEKIWIWACLSDKPGFIIFDSCYGQGDRQGAVSRLYPSMKATVWDRTITSTNRVVVFMAKGDKDFREFLPYTPTLANPQRSPYRAEADFEDVIMARTEMAYHFEWR